MKRAYPQYLAAGGEKLPRELLRVIFPVDYWDLIQQLLGASTSSIRTSSRRSIAQESTFVADIKSSANAVRPDAAAAVDRPPVRAQAAACRRSRSSC